MKRLFASLFVVSTLTPVLAAQDTSLNGNWKIHSNSMGNESDLQCTFAQKDKDVAGTCKGDQDTMKITGNIDGKKITWQFKSEYNGQPLTLVYTGTMETAGEITGTVDIQPMAVSGEFTAKQAK